MWVKCVYVGVTGPITRRDGRVKLVGMLRIIKIRVELAAYESNKIK